MKTILNLCAALAMALAAIPACAHWPGQPEHQMAQLGDLKLETGEVIRDFRASLDLSVKKKKGESSVTGETS